LPAAIMLGGAFASIGAYFVSIELISWRVAFLIGAILGLIAFYYRYKTSETIPFKYHASNNLLLKCPLDDIFKNDKYKIFCSFIMSFGTVVPFHLNYVYMGDFIKNTLHIPTTTIISLNFFTQVLTIILMPIFGYIADKTDKRIVMSISLIILMFISYPLILYNNNYPSLLISTFILFTLSISLSAYSGPFFSSVGLLFPVNRRYTASGLSVSTGVALFSFISSFFIWSAYKDNLFLYTIGPMFLLYFLNTRFIFNHIELK